ncbi:hypothetical protein M0804_010754 [Polistes exclamans]|nr:hypothetical protein M0804_010754 [Polistes exclamans]
MEEAKEKEEKEKEKGKEKEEEEEEEEEEGRATERHGVFDLSWLDRLWQPGKRVHVMCALLVLKGSNRAKSQDKETA